jgi:vancomycin resistance protein YoaR
MMDSPEEARSLHGGGGPLMRQVVLAYLLEEGVAAAQAGRRQRAEGYLQQALALDGADADLWALLGSIMEGPARAACARQALFLDSQHVQARALLGEPAPQDPDFRLPTPRLQRGGRVLARPRPRPPAGKSTPRALAISLPWPALPALPTISPRGRVRILAAVILLLALALNVALASAYARQYEDRIFPGVRIAGLEAGGLSRPQARSLLQQQVASLLDRPVVLRHSEQAWSLTARQAGLHYRIDEAVQEASDLGRPPSAWSAWFERLRLGLWGQDVPLLAEVQAEPLQAVLDQVVATLDRPAIPPTVVWQDGNWAILPGQDGRRVVREALEQRLLAALAALVHGEGPPVGTPLEVPVPTITETAALSAPGAARLRQQLDEVGRPLLLRCAEHSWTVQTTDIAAWVRVQLAPQPGPVSVQIDAAAVRTYLADLAAEVKVPVQLPRLEMQGDRVVAFQTGEDGRRMDVDAALSQVSKAFQGRLTGEPVDTVELTTTVVPAGDDALMSELGIVELIGEGHSSFIGSPWNRITNIVVGGRELHGRLIAPDEVFSLNAALDPITWEKGYVLSEVIGPGGIVQLGLGGGICQVATTLYRAALYSGLEIVERTPHLWRLDWYEYDSPPGFDATIMLGGPDLKIRNNTGHYILIQVETNTEQSWQVVRFYGTDPGWTVTISEPVITNGGHSVSFERTVTRDGVVLIQETVYSSYQ